MEKPDFQLFFDDFLAAGEAALAADLITAWKTLRGGCASSRLDHGFPRHRTIKDDNIGILIVHLGARSVQRLWRREHTRQTVTGGHAACSTQRVRLCEHEDQLSNGS